MTGDFGAKDEVISKAMAVEAKVVRAKTKGIAMLTAPDLLRRKCMECCCQLQIENALCLTPDSADPSLQTDLLLHH